MSLKTDSFFCTYCLKRFDRKELQLDHVDPTSKGGADEPGNLVLACASCNMSKGAMTILQWAQAEGRASFLRARYEKPSPERTDSAYAPLSRKDARAVLTELRDLNAKVLLISQRINALSSVLWEGTQPDRAPATYSGADARINKTDLRAIRQKHDPEHDMTLINAIAEYAAERRAAS